MTGNSVIVDVNGVGYRVVIPEKKQSSIAEIGSKINFYTHFVLNPRDGQVELYGFDTPEELAFFELLTTISGIGPKSAQGILSRADLQQLQLAIINEDQVYLTKTAGLGPKTSQRLILELKTKIASVNLGVEAGTKLQSESESLEALVALGYNPRQAREVLEGLRKKEMGTEDRISEALRLLAKK